MSKRPNTQETTGASAGVGITLLALVAAAANGTPLPPEFAVIAAAVAPIVTYLVRLYRNRVPRISRDEFDHLQKMVKLLVDKEQQERARKARVAQFDPGSIGAEQTRRAP